MTNRLFTPARSSNENLSRNLLLDTLPNHALEDLKFHVLKSASVARVTGNSFALVDIGYYVNPAFDLVLAGPFALAVAGVADGTRADL